MRISGASQQGSRAILARVVRQTTEGSEAGATAARVTTSLGSPVMVSDLGMALGEQPYTDAERISVELGPASFHGEPGLRHGGLPAALQTLAAVRGYTAELQAYAPESQRVGRILDLKA